MALLPFNRQFKKRIEMHQGRLLVATLAISTVRQCTKAVQILLLSLMVFLPACAARQLDTHDLVDALKSRNKNCIYVAIKVLGKYEDVGQILINYDAPYRESEKYIDACVSLLDSYTEEFLKKMNDDYQLTLHQHSPIWAGDYWQ